MINILIAIIALGIVVFFHEFGHFIYAKKAGIRVYTFSIGFGPKIWSVNYKNTEYRISLIPFGGYVSMAGENIENSTGEPYEYQSKTIWQRFKVVFAGPLMNFILAFIFIFITLLIGIKEPKKSDKPMSVYIVKNSLAEKKGLESGDKIIEVNNNKINYWGDFLKEMSLSSDEAEILCSDISKNKQKKVNIKLKKDSYTGRVNLKEIGIQPLIKPIISQVAKDTPAKKIGLKPGDKIIEVNSKKVKYKPEIDDIIKNTGGLKLTLKIERNGNIINKETKLKKMENGRKILGVAFETNMKFITKKYPVHTAFVKGFSEFGKVVKLMYKSIKMLVTGGASVKSMGGPVAIVQMTSMAAVGGVVPLFQFIALISINLGIINLLPIPITDGGHILFLLIEKIKGSPVNEKVISISMNISVILLLLLAAIITYNDILRIIKGKF